jgi:hypothetical protein
MFVHDLQSYNIDYTLSNVTQSATYDSQAWAVNGYDWAQPLGQVTARLHLASDLENLMVPRATRCTTGPEGTTAQACTVESSTTPAGETVIAVTATRPLDPGESLNSALQFEPDTFAATRLRSDHTVTYALYLLVFFAITAVVIITYLIRRRGNTHLEYATEVLIDAPLGWVTDLFKDPANAVHWQPGLSHRRPLDGAPGQVGSRSVLVYMHNENSIEVTETIVSNNLPSEFTVTYDSPGIHNLVKSFFVEIDKTHTKWITIDQYELSGFQRLAASFRPDIFRRESRKYLQNFKNFAEKGHNPRKNS